MVPNLTKRVDDEMERKWDVQDDIWVSASTIAERLFGGEVSEDTVWRWARTGVVPYTRTQGKGIKFHLGMVKQALMERTEKNEKAEEADVL